MICIAACICYAAVILFCWWKTARTPLLLPDIPPEPEEPAWVPPVFEDDIVVQIMRRVEAEYVGTARELQKAA